MAHLMKNGRLGIEAGEVPGALHDTLVKVAPGLVTMRKCGGMPDIPPLDMRVEPGLPPL